MIEFEINDYRIELRCSICKGLIKWWLDEPERMVPLKRAWSYEESSEMR
jgi:hypothetical protein